MYCTEMFCSENPKVRSQVKRILYVEFFLVYKLKPYPNMMSKELKKSYEL